MAIGYLKASLCIFIINILLIYHNIRYHTFIYRNLNRSKKLNISGYGTTPNNVPHYIRHQLSNNIDCEAYFVNTSTKNANRISLTDPIDYKTDCSSIKSRFVYSKKPRLKEEKRFPIAFLRAVYRDYVFLETIFRAQYEPQNVYGYVLDSKSDALFKKRIRDLGNCFSNVVVVEQEFDIKGNGKNVTRAFMAGFEALKGMKWRYVITLQNHDIVFKTNAELVRILTAFGGANDISTGKRAAAIPYDVKFTIQNMKLFKNETQNQLARPIRLQILKSLVEVSISRAAVNYIIDVLNTSTLIENLEKVNFGMDENFFATLNANEGVDLPGGFSTLCLAMGVHTQSITRFTVWNSNDEDCKSGLLRHGICIFGTEYLFDIVGQPGIVANKFFPEFDFGAVECLLERLHNRTYGMTVPSREEMNVKIYEDLRHVRYHRARLANGKRRPTKFKC